METYKILKKSIWIIFLCIPTLMYAQWSQNASSVYLTDPSKRVGIGTSFPKQKLHVTGDYYGRGHVYLYAYEGDGNTGNAFVQGRDDSGTSSITLVLRSQNSGSINNAMVIRPNGNVDIATISTSTFKLQVNGSAAKPGGGSWSTLSDEKLKKDVFQFKDGLNVIKKINPVWFRYNGKLGLRTDKQYVGTVAQELAKVAPYMVEESTFENYDSLSKTQTRETMLTANYSALDFVFVNALKEQQQMIEAQQEQIEQLEDRLSKLEKIINGTGSIDKTSNEGSGFGMMDQNIPFLEQSFPNPSKGREVIIPYFVPEQSERAEIIIFNFQGEELMKRSISVKGKFSLPVANLKNGLYYYSLIVDGEKYGTKKIVINH